jgi:hypothetical protein
MGFLGGSSGGWDASRGVVDELRGTGMHCGGAGRCSGVDEVGRVVVVVVDVVVDASCDAALDGCDVGCDEGMGGEVSVGKTGGLDSDELVVGLGVIPFLGHSFSNASQRCSQVSFCAVGRACHHRSAYEIDFRCISKTWSIILSVTPVSKGIHISSWYRKSRGSSCSKSPQKRPTDFIFVRVERVGM